MLRRVEEHLGERRKTSVDVSSAPCGTVPCYDGGTKNMIAGKKDGTRRHVCYEETDKPSVMHTSRTIQYVSTSQNYGSSSCTDLQNWRESISAIYRVEKIKSLSGCQPIQSNTCSVHPILVGVGGSE